LCKERQIINRNYVKVQISLICCKNNTIFMKIKVYNITIFYYVLLYGCENWLLKLKEEYISRNYR